MSWAYQVRILLGKKTAGHPFLYDGRGDVLAGMLNRTNLLLRLVASLRSGAVRKILRLTSSPHTMVRTWRKEQLVRGLYCGLPPSLNCSNQRAIAS